MVANQSGSPEPPDKRSGELAFLPRTSGAERGQRPRAASLLASTSGSWVRPALLGDEVEQDVCDLSEESAAVKQGSNVEPTPELGIFESGTTQVVQVGDRPAIGAAVPADAAQPGRHFAPPAGRLMEAVDAPAGDAGPETASVLGQIGRIEVAPPQPLISAAHDDRVAIPLPKQFGRYRILEQLGTGAMGAIYLANDTELGRQVALKVPHLRRGRDGTTPDRCDLDRFYREARAAATLDHPNLCPVYDVGQIDGIPYLSMAYIKGRPLSQSMRRDRPMSQRRVAIMVRKLAQALEEAHYNGVVHRDLKPSNIMINARGELIIIDFGLVWRIGAQNERLTRVGLVVGTPMYMSPEQASGKLEAIGPGCDIYSLGVIMYELLTGRVPFEGPEAFVLGQVFFAEPTPPSMHRADLDSQLEAICLKAMAKSPDQRYATMGEFAMALGEYLRPVHDTPRTIDVRLPGVADLKSADTHEERAADPSPQPAETADEVPVGPELPIEVPESGTPWRAWRQWTLIVEHFALRRSPGNVNKTTYANLYECLVAGCRARAAKAHGLRQQFYLELVELVLPWMSPTVLESTDREILFSLLSHCRRFEQELLDPTELLPEPQEKAGTWLVAGLSIALFVATFILVLLWRYWAR
jgi:serine/threonine protein kinase